MWAKVKAFLIDKLDADRNGKVNLRDAEARFGVLLVRGFLIGLSVGVPVAFVLGRMTK